MVETLPRVGGVYVKPINLEIMKKHEPITHFDQIDDPNNYIVIRHPYGSEGVPEILTGDAEDVINLICEIFKWDPEDYKDFNDFLQSANEKNGDGWDYLQIIEL